MEQVRIEPLKQPFDMDFTPPGSKSLTNRALVLAALGRGTCTLTNALFADDTRVMLDGLQRLGFAVEADEATNTIRVTGGNGRVPTEMAELFCGNSGTTIRFLTALCALGHGRYTLDGVERMRQRPIGPLVTMLRHLGVRISHVTQAGFPPVSLDAHHLPGGLVRYGSETSSQYLSAVLHVACYARNEVQIDLGGPQTSWPYITMTMRLMDEFGVTCELERDPLTADPTRIIVPRGYYALGDYAVEPDASNASYFLALAALHEGSTIRLAGLGTKSLQGDVHFAAALKAMGASVKVAARSITITGTGELEGIDVDLAEMPDTAQTLAVVACCAKGETVIRGLHTLRVKETDRLAALQTELTKLGADVSIDGDEALHITPPEKLQPATIDTYDDHRMAMSFALAGSKAVGVRINDPECVNKTYPGYFQDLSRFGVTSG